MEFGAAGCRLHPEIDPASGRFTLMGKTHDHARLFTLAVPREKVQRVLAAIQPALAAESAFKIVPGRLWAFGKVIREAVASQGRGLVAALADEATPVPYIHVFALLNLLKQICNHPALALKAADQAERYASGKWDLFTELLAEGLDSGQKIVVYSQYLDMIRIITAHLADLNVDFVSLTGASRGRGDTIARFQNDAACRVIVCSLKAGGVGIDLVAASMVIHGNSDCNSEFSATLTGTPWSVSFRRGMSTSVSAM